MGSGLGDLELEGLEEAAEAEIVAQHSFLGSYGPLLERLCHDRCRDSVIMQCVPLLASKHYCTTIAPNSATGVLQLQTSLMQVTTDPQTLHCTGRPCRVLRLSLLNHGRLLTAARSVGAWVPASQHVGAASICVRVSVCGWRHNAVCQSVRSSCLTHAGL